MILLLGKGDGTFETRRDLDSTSKATGIAVGDMNGDSVVDIVVVSGVLNKVGVLIGRGDGTFQASRDIAVTNYPESIALADINGDSKLDVVVGGRQSSKVSVLKGKGDGSLFPEASFAAGLSADSLSLKDINGDGKLDLGLVDGSSGTVNLLVGGGDGTFQPPVTFTTGNPAALSVADVNNDGKPDLVTSGYGQLPISIHLNQQNGHFQGQAYTIKQIPVIEFAVSNSNGSESVRQIQLTVSIAGAFTDTASVVYDVLANNTSAIGGGIDFRLTSGILSFVPGETSKSISFEVIDDQINESNETVSIFLSSPTNARVGNIATHTYSIFDNDLLPTIGFSIVSSSGNEANAQARLTVSLSALSGREVTAFYQVTGGTANGNGIDYTLSSGTLNFAPGETSKEILISLVNDTQRESNETIEVTLLNNTNSMMSGNTVHIFTIIDDESSLSRTITVVVHGFQNERNIPGWAEAIAISASRELEKYTEGNATFEVSWDGGSSSNDEPTSQVAEKIAGFLQDPVNAGVWDMLLIGHSRGGIFVNKVLDKLNERLPDQSRLGFVQQILLDPTGAVPINDYFPTGIPSLADRTIDYHDNHTLLNGLLQFIPYFGKARAQVSSGRQIH